MKIEKLIEELQKIRDSEPEKDVVIEVFDTKDRRVEVGYMFELQIYNSQHLVHLRQKSLRGHNLYMKRTEDLEEIEKGLFLSK